MGAFALASDAYLQVEESNYDETVEGIVFADLRVRSDGVPDRIFKVRLVELADALKAMLFKCALQDGQYSELLWDTGEAVGMRRISPGRLAVELPIGTGPINVTNSETGDFILLLYKESLATLSVHAGART